jgi:hypothetical protein
MKIPRKRKNNKKKNYGSANIPTMYAKMETHNLWWQLVFKLKSKQQQSLFKIL